jgi:hypothetical protein
MTEEAGYKVHPHCQEVKDVDLLLTLEGQPAPPSSSLSISLNDFAVVKKSISSSRALAPPEEAGKGLFGLTILDVLTQTSCPEVDSAFDTPTADDGEGAFSEHEGLYHPPAFKRI